MSDKKSAYIIMKVEDDGTVKFLHYAHILGESEQSWQLGYATIFDKKKMEVVLPHIKDEKYEIISLENSMRVEANNIRVDKTCISTKEHSHLNLAREMDEDI